MPSLFKLHQAHWRLADKVMGGGRYLSPNPDWPIYPAPSLCEHALSKRCPDTNQNSFTYPQLLGTHINTQISTPRQSEPSVFCASATVEQEDWVGIALRPHTYYLRPHTYYLRPRTCCGAYSKRNRPRNKYGNEVGGYGNEVGGYGDEVSKTIL
ncbi:hypothetical protein FACS1894104_1980 [Actinomycetota bacterium]|nr:hypothetical protein FACS1894104_1980 [Actinomycetota bacterium]